MAAPFQDRFPKRESRASFTLVELLMAMAVLSIMLALLAAMVQLISVAWKAGMARADNFTQTRVVLGLIERDIQSMVLRPDVPAFTDPAGNPALAFYTRTPGGGGSSLPGGGPNNRKVSLVEYAIYNNPATGGPQLLRYDNGGLTYAYYLAGTTYAVTNIAGTYSYVGVPATINTPPPDMEIVASGTTNLAYLPVSPLATNSTSGAVGTSGVEQAQVLVNGVVALQIQFLESNPTQTLQSYFYFNYSAPAATTNTPVVVVSLVVLDTAAYQLATTSSAFAKLSADLGSTPTAGQTYAQYWNTRVLGLGFGSDLPKQVRAGLRVFERRIAIPVPLTIID